MRQLVIHGNKKSIIDKAINPEILVYTDDTTVTQKSMDITGDRIVNFKYKIDIDGTTILQDYGSYSINDVNLTNITLPSNLTIGTHTLNITAIQDDGATITQNATINVYSKRNFAREFSGSDKIDFGNPLLFNLTTGTLEVLMKTNDIASLSTIGGKSGAWTIPTVNNSYADNKYHMISFAFENVTVNGNVLYVDGVQQGTSTIPSMVQTNNLIIGSLFKGTIEEVRLWNRKLTIDEINKFKGVQLKGNETGLIGYWRLNELEGDVAFDSTGNGNNGTYIGTSATMDTILDDLYNANVNITVPSATVLKNTDYNFQFNIEKPLAPVDIIIYPNSPLALSQGNSFSIPIDLNNFETVTGIGSM